MPSFTRSSALAAAASLGRNGWRSSIVVVVEPSQRIDNAERKRQRVLGCFPKATVIELGEVGGVDELEEIPAERRGSARGFNPPERRAYLAAYTSSLSV